MISVWHVRHAQCALVGATNLEITLYLYLWEYCVEVIVLSVLGVI